MLYKILQLTLPGAVRFVKNESMVWNVTSWPSTLRNQSPVQHKRRKLITLNYHFTITYPETTKLRLCLPKYPSTLPFHDQIFVRAKTLDMGIFIQFSPILPAASAI